MLDYAAFLHDKAYFLAQVGGVDGALNQLSVTKADKNLADAASKIMKAYFKGEIDPITGSKISERTYRTASLVYSAFRTIEKKKYGEVHTNSAINSFYQNILFNIINSRK
ncbi:hypothetical protein OKW96_11640 [Sphingobacterium sp. KU25419]|nr:hypothetical protein OKW96_11640 [Sphingobacterium sp. KU25419]